MTYPHCILYTFARPLYEGMTPCGVGLVKVARVTKVEASDWFEWPDRYIKDHPGLRLLEISSIDLVDE